MTMNLPICTIKAKNVLGWRDGENKLLETIPVRLDWVTHGNFSLTQGENYLDLEKEHFDEIIQSMQPRGETEPSPEWEPRCMLKVPPRGWGTLLGHGHTLFVYRFYTETCKNILIESRWKMPQGYPNKDVNQIGLSLDCFKVLRQFAHDCRGLASVSIKEPAIEIEEVNCEMPTLRSGSIQLPPLHSEDPPQQ